LRLQALTHLAAAAHALVGGKSSILILGSSSLLASFPQLGNAGQPLESSFDADLLVEPYDVQASKVLYEAIGENSIFHGRTGYYADIMLPAATDTFPRGWKKRLVSLPNSQIAFCLDPQDLAAMKLQMGRPKDLELCTALLATGRLHADSIRKRLRETRMEDRARALATTRLNRVIEMAGEIPKRKSRRRR
jgi:hypothetical protein